MGIEFLLFMGVLIVGMFVMNSFAKKSAKKRQDAQEVALREQMVPGAWVQTYSGFFGRFVDIDGDVVILETPSGEETYWLRQGIRAVTDPPFEALADVSDIDAITGDDPVEGWESETIIEDVEPSAEGDDAPGATS